MSLKSGLRLCIPVHSCDGLNAANGVSFDWKRHDRLGFLDAGMHTVNCPVVRLGRSLVAIGTAVTLIAFAVFAEVISG